MNFKLSVSEEVFNFLSQYKGKKFDTFNLPLEARAICSLYLREYEGTNATIETLRTQTYHSPAQIALILNNALAELFNEKPPETIEEIEAAIAKIQVQLTIHKSGERKQELEASVTKSRKDEEEIIARFNAKLEKLRMERSKTLTELSNLDSQVIGLQTSLEALEKQQANLLKILAAQAKLDEFKLTINELMASQPWFEKIRPFQIDDVTYTVSAFLSGKRGILNANDMGLGKTMEAGATLDLITPLFEKEYGRAPLILWLTKKTLVGSSFRELRKWNDKRRIAVVPGSMNATVRNMTVEFAIMAGAWVIVNYDALATTPLLKNTEWDIIVMDEVHKLKGGALPKPTQIFVNTLEACKKAKFVLPLSGTPIQNHPKEMWCYLHIFDPIAFPTVRDFEDRFCMGYGKYDEDGKPLVSISWDKLINVALKDRVIRRSKKDAGLNLPDKTREFRYVELTGQQLEHYRNLRDHFFVWLDGQKEKSLTATSVIAQLTRLRQCAILPKSIEFMGSELDCDESAKLDEAVELIDQLVGAGENVVVFSSQFNAPLFELHRRLSKYKTMVVTGKNSKNFSEIEQAFQQGEIQVLLVNMKTGSEGLNLQKSVEWSGGASHCIFLDLWWNPATMLQGEDRLHRQGQTESVTCHYILAEDSVDNLMSVKLEEKESMIAGIMERDEIRTGETWKTLLEGMI